jgi:hypothetical protein
LIWLRIGATAGTCEYGNKFSGYIRCSGVEENIWTKEGWSDGRVEEAA